jgi:hypothetical protein
MIGVVLNFFSFRSIFVDAVVIVIALYLPFHGGKKLFLCKKDEAHSDF